MSIQAMAWAIEQQQVKDATSRHVLLCVANYASATGLHAFPSIRRLCRDSGLSESTVRRHIDALKREGILVEGNQAIAAVHITRADQRPIVYDLIIKAPINDNKERGVTVTPGISNGVSLKPERGVTEEPRGVKEGLTGCHSLTPDPKRSVREPIRDPKDVLSKTEREALALQDFNEDFKMKFGKYPSNGLAKPLETKQ